MTSPLCRLATLLALSAAGAAAQGSVSDWNTVKALAIGTQVRIAAGSRTVAGRVDRVLDDALVVTSGKGRETFDRPQVSAVSVKKAGHRPRNTLIGLAAGAGIGLAIGLASRSKPGQLKFVSNGEAIGGFTAAGAVLGTIVGVVIPTGGWREIYKK